MELIQATYKASILEPEDFISNMPDNVVTSIMDRLPLQDAVRTSILSRNWRFKWTMLSQLVFDKNFFEYVLETKGESDFGIIISRLLFHPKVVITKFVLYINEPRYFINVEDISRWILFVSRKGIKDLNLGKWSPCGSPLKLPTDLFSCLELKHLKLENCCFDPPTSFHGFPNLLRLELWKIEFESVKFGELFSWCPILEILNLGYAYHTNELKPTEIAKLASLKTFSLSLRSLDKPGPSSIIELVGFLPKLQELHINFMRCKLTEGAKKSFPTTFPCLKTLKLSTIDLGDGFTLSCAFEMIKSFSNLQTLEISASELGTSVTPGICFPEIDYNTVGLLQLRSLVFDFFAATENEVCLIKFLLACSPFLKKIVIHPHPFLPLVEQLRFARKLLKLQRTYPAVYMDLH